MKAYRAKFTGRWGHFRRPEANNNPVTYDFLPKTAFIGMIGAVVGLSRKELKEVYTELCNTIFFNIQILNPISKIATNFRIYKYGGSLSSSSVSNVPQFYELLQDPSFRITFFGESEVLEKFVNYLQQQKSIFTPTFGLASCPVNIEEFRELEIRKIKNRSFETQGFIPFECKPKVKRGITLSYDEIPVVQNNDWLNIEYKKVFYGYIPDGKSIEVGESDYDNQYVADKIGYFFI